MFLDDKLYQTVKGVDLSHWSAKSKVINDMVKVFLDHFTMEVGKIQTDDEFIILMKKCKKHWDNAITKLKKENIDLRLMENSFEIIVLKCPYFDNIRDEVLRKIKE